MEDRRRAARWRVAADAAIDVLDAMSTWHPSQ
jgi:hypothetical protein